MFDPLKTRVLNRSYSLVNKKWSLHFKEYISRTHQPFWLSEAAIKELSLILEDLVFNEIARSVNPELPAQVCQGVRQSKNLRGLDYPYRLG